MKKGRKRRRMIGFAQRGAPDQMLVATDAGVEAVRGDARIGQPSGQLGREEDVRELRPRVGLHDAVAALEPEVVEVQGAADGGRWRQP